ncbi:hypothetical protein [Rhodosalinus sediminis]|uniref:hypothetical protein n=1 Tax=Rhodosalinus sediminis TaxID=1940533 RepID=UPI0011C04D6A|nr:hypothetical protein [Rhodosalinus sediminis]
MEGAEFSTYYDVETRAVDGLSDIYRHIHELQHAPNTLVIRGQLIDGSPSSGVRRRSKAKGDQPAHFERVSRRWLMIDIDELPLPPEWADVNTHADQVVAHAVSQLPRQFQNAAGVYQWSGSMGFKRDQIRLHLWFWVSRPVSDLEAKAWLQGAPVDLSLYNPVHPHFTANPIIDGKLADPIETRVGLYQPDGTNSVVSVPDDLAIRAAHRPRAIHSGGRKGGGAPQAVVRDKQTGRVIDGRERFLFLCSNEAAAELVRGLNSKAALPTAEDIAQLTWEKFSAEADLTDGRWTHDDAHKEAARRYAELRDGIYSFKAKDDGIMLLPAPRPYHDLKPVNRDEAAARLEGTLARFFANVDDGPRQVVRITMGAGKTRQTIKYLQAFLNRHVGKRVEIYVPQHALAHQYIRDIEALGGLRAQLIHVKPRTPRGDDVEGLCERPQYVRRLEQAGLGVFRYACRSDNGDRCVHYDGCRYIKQFANPQIWEAPETCANVVRIGVHSYLGLPRNPIQADPDLVIIDEAFVEQMVSDDQLVRRAEVRQYIKSPDHPKLGRHIVEALEDGEPVLKRLRESGVNAGDLNAIDVEGLRPEHDFDASQTSEPAVRGQPGLYYRLRRLIDILRDELALAPARDHVERLVYSHGDDAVRLCYMLDLDLPETTAILCLDATADPMLLEKVLGPLKVETIDVRQRAFVSQVYDRTGSKSYWVGKTAPIGKLIDVANAWADFGERPLIVGSKDLEQRLRSEPSLHADVEIMHFSALRGSNAAEDCSVIFLAGRNMPRPSSVDYKARAMFWDDPELLQHDLGVLEEGGVNPHVRLPAELRGYTQSDLNPRPQSGVYVPCFSDPRIEAIHAQIREAETMQALGRLRLVHSPYRKRLFLLSNLPVEVSVDRLLAFDNLMPDRLEMELLRKGHVPLTPVGLMKMRPDLVTSEEQAKKLLQRSRVSQLDNLKALPDLRRFSLFAVEFEAKNAGRTTHHKHLFIVPGQRGERQGDAPEVLISVGKLPVKDWLELLERGDEQIEGSGWGSVEVCHIRATGNVQGSDQ